MADDKLFTTPPNKQKPKPPTVPQPTGYMVKKDTTVAGTIGLIRVEAYQPIKDLFIIHRLKAAGVELEPLYD